jgi:hypothetical protein
LADGKCLPCVVAHVTKVRSHTKVRSFCFLCSLQTLTVADPRNLPTSLKEVARVQVDLDYRYSFASD